MLNILLFWAGKNVDAFRCDMAEMVPVEFWNWAIGEVKKQFEGILFIAEVYNPEQYRNYLRIGKFDYLYDKVGLYDTLKNIMINNQSAHSVTGCWQSVDDIQSNMLNFLENHDEQRIASDFFAKNPFKALPALVVSATMNSNPFLLYFGQELGEKGMDSEGFSGLDGRTTIFDYWSIESIRNWRNKGQYNENLLSEEQKELRNYYIKILQLCNQNKAIREGQFYDLMYVNTGKPDFNPHRQFAYMRCYEEELLLIVANFDDRPTDVNVFIPAHAFEYFGVREDKIKAVKELITNEKYAADLSKDSDFSVHIKGNNAVIVQFKADCRPLRVKK
jgi:glycosidase